MTALPRKRRPAVGAAEPAGQGYKGEAGQYSSAGGKARSKKSDPFTIFKWAWLDQVATDASLPPASYRIAILIAGRHLNRKTGEAWPGVEKLAAALSVKSANTIRTALRAMEAGGHMVVKWSTGGKNQTNHFRPLVGGIPFKNLKGMEGSNPSNIERDTLQNRDAKPLKNLKGNPMKEPYDEPRRAPGARAYGDDHQCIDSLPEGSDALEGASGQGDVFAVGEPIEVGSHGICIIHDFGLVGKTRFVKARIIDSEKLVFVPVNENDRLLVNDAMFTAEFEATYRLDDARWGDAINTSAPKARRRRDAAA